MFDSFKEEFFWMLREGKGYFPWLKGHSYRLARHLRRHHGKRCHMCHEDLSSRDLIRSLTEENVFEHPLIDIAIKALIRAEVRLISRFIPQHSHEERLTGNLVSEIDNAFFLVQNLFQETSSKLYSETKEIDFFYYDLSRGGRIEKTTGADLGLIIVIDLPDFPFSVKSLILQAKKLSPNAKIEKHQYEVLAGYKKKESAYLFYDMDLSRRCSPLVVPANSHCLSQRYEECKSKDNDSFSLPFDDACSYGNPLSLFLTSEFIFGEAGESHSTFKNAFGMFNDLCYKINRSDFDESGFNGRLGILSFGKKINFSTQHNENLVIEI